MPSTITYVNQHGQEIEDELEDLEDDNDDGLSYEDSACGDKWLMSNSDQDSAQDDTDSDDGSESDDDDDDDPGNDAERDESDLEDPALVHPNQYRIHSCGDMII
jgi:hypothetical protein